MQLYERLSKEFHDNVSLHTLDLKRCSVDESILQIKPRAVVSPSSSQDLIKLVEIAQEYKVPVRPRGGGSGVTGAALTDGIVLDFRKNMNKIVELADDHAWVEPGVFLGELNQMLRPRNKIFGPDPGSGDYACMGGIVANNAAGPRALQFGMTRDHVKEIQCVLASKVQASTLEMNESFADLTTWLQSQKESIRQTQVQVSKNSAGLYVEEFLNETPQYEKLLCGSEGELALFHKIKVNLVDLPDDKTFLIYQYPDRISAVADVERILQSNPACVELIDSTIHNALYAFDATFCGTLNLQKGKVSLWVEHFEHQKNDPQAIFFTDDQDHIQRIWKARSLASKLLHEQASHFKPLRCIEDACVPVANLVEYLKEVESLLKTHGCSGAIFGHVGNGHLHINPSIDVTQSNLVEKIQNLMDDFYRLVEKYQGTISGEHGIGLLRKKYAPLQWKERTAMIEKIKNRFDPSKLFRHSESLPFKQHF